MFEYGSIGELKPIGYGGWATLNDLISEVPALGRDVKKVSCLRSEVSAIGRKGSSHIGGDTNQKHSPRPLEETWILQGGGLRRVSPSPYDPYAIHKYVLSQYKDYFYMASETTGVPAYVIATTIYMEWSICRFFESSDKRLKI